MSQHGKTHRSKHGNGGRPEGGRRAISGRTDLQGRISITRRGQGFVQTKRGRWLVPRGKLNYAMDGDVVEVAPLPQRSGGKRLGADDTPHAEVATVIERTCFELVGRYERSGTLGVVMPLDERVTFDLFCDARETEARTGDLVVCRIERHPVRGMSAEAVITEVLGREDNPVARRDALVRLHGIERAFPAEAEKQAESLALDVDAALADPLRRDLRDRHVLTIDPLTARDFDDALSLEELDGGGWRLGVHIADVSAYVPWGTPLDVAARERATSVYLVDEVIPMLPDRLSCDLCSLNSDEDRLAMTVDVEFGSGLGIKSVEMYPSVIRSRLRLTYDQVQAALEGVAAPPAFSDGAPSDETLRQLDRIAKHLKARRRDRGALDLGGAEPEVVCGARGEVVDVQLRVQNDATSLVEEAMILANTLVAERFAKAHRPLIYRVHDEPREASLLSLAGTLEEFGWDVAPEQLHDARTLQQLLDGANGEPEAELLGMLVLRSMKQAAYSAELAGHYGLGLEAYCHFTSPIRRYPDLVGHRLLKALLTGSEAPQDMLEGLAWLAEHSSVREREADEAERESETDAIIAYLGDHAGEVFEGVVSGISRDGVFVRLDLTVEGVIPPASLGEDADFDRGRHALEGRTSHRVWRLGTRVRVRVDEVVPQRRGVRLSLADAPTRQPDARKRKRRR